MRVRDVSWEVTPAWMVSRSLWRIWVVLPAYTVRLHLLATALLVLLLGSSHPARAQDLPDAKSGILKSAGQSVPSPMSNPWTAQKRPHSLTLSRPAIAELQKQVHPSASVKPPASLPVPQHARSQWPHSHDVDAVTWDSVADQPFTTRVGGSAVVGPSSLTTALDPSPAAILGFQGLTDNGTSAAPDTSGAVGPNHVLTFLNSEVHAQDRSGASLAKVSLDEFFIDLDPSIFVYDPRCLYDASSQRWIVTGAANPATDNPGLVVAVSTDSDPLGNWYRYFFPLNPPGGVYALSPTVGFNRQWIVVQADVFGQTNGVFQESQILAIGKVDLYGGLPAQFARFRLSAEDYGGGHIPATVLDPAETRLPLVKNWTGYDKDPGTGLAEGFLRVFMLEGSVGRELLYATNFVGTAQEGLTTPFVWADSVTDAIDLGPQKDSTAKVQLGDSRISSVVFRGGSLWCSQMIYLPALNPTRASVQWWEIFPDGRIFQRHQVDDPTGQWSYAYPSLAVNNHYDALLGYNGFSATAFAGGYYRFYPNDGVNNQPRAEQVLKSGEGSYVEYYNDRNLWGDWSAACVDPVNDGALWTLQEYALAPTASDTGRFGVWWGQIVPEYDLNLAVIASTNRLVVGQEFTLTLLASNRITSFAYDATVTFPLPVGLTLSSATSTQGVCRVESNVVLCTYSRIGLAPVRAELKCIANGSSLNVTSLFRLQALGPDSNTNNNSFSTAVTLVDAPPLVLPVVEPQLSDGKLKLRWPVGYLGFQVESSDRLFGAPWQAVTGNVVINGPWRELELGAPTSTATTARFYRIRRP